MFLEKTIKRNPKLIEAAFELHRSGQISPDTYLIDINTLTANAQKIKKEADKYGVKLYFMTKQLGRNPLIASKISEIGYEGAVTVDFREAQNLIENNIKIGNVGHLVQIPHNSIKKILMADPLIVTVYSYQKIREIDEQACALGKVQDIMLRVYDDKDEIYPSQNAGFRLEELSGLINSIKKLKNVKLTGLTSFPCFIYDEKQKDIMPTHNVLTLKKAEEICIRNGISLTQINMPSVTCVRTVQKISDMGGTHGEPGHGLTGTTPMHRDFDLEELPAMVYVSEVSHNFSASAYIFGGGHYRRSHMENAIIGSSLSASVTDKVIMPDPQSIDYHIQLQHSHEVGQCVVMSFRSQIFVTRSNVAVVDLSGGQTKLLGVYDSQGKIIGR